MTKNINENKKLLMLYISLTKFNRGTCLYN